jgi:phosphate transport system protein
MLEDLRRRLLQMAALAESMIDQAIVELIQRNEELAGPILEAERQVNQLQMDIDDVAMKTLATQQPVAQDLRFLVAATRINGELERVGDLAINITQCVRTLAKQPPLKPLVDIPRMAELSRQMVRQSIEAFTTGDELLAQRVIMADDQVDALKDQVFRELLTYMMADPASVERAMALILISRHLERVGDHATNIAQDVIYMVRGRDVRHPKRE